ncbi:hypothetical protein [Methylomarinum vadi]|uniref:hypothetical protein n=1 Tax=Methylomarinum vadi TaxID=438855 RepID=UPI0012691BEA|nr:hypothetical protein [Methylomarinum vadi]
MPQSNRIHRRLQFRAVTSLVLISLLLGAVFTYLLYRAERRQLEAALLSAMELQTAALEAEINRLKNITTQITSRTRIRQELEKYNRGLISQEALAAFSRPKLADAMRLAPDMIGISRLSTKGRVLIQIGESVPTSLWPKDFAADSIKLGTPREIDGRKRLVLSAPINNREGMKAGIDLVVFDYQRLDAILHGFFLRYRGSGTIRLAAREAAGITDLLTSIKSNHRDLLETINGQVKQFPLEKKATVHLLSVPDGKQLIVALNPIGDTG